MRCHQAEHLLSLNLDGRLSSGQRKLLFDHLDECAACRQIDDELNAARELALSLPTQSVSAGFREELWERIRAGEGTPEAVFREPVPLATKVRYFATGAAAAGLLIAATVSFFRPAGETTPTTEPLTTGPQLAQHDRGGLTPRPVGPVANTATLDLPGVAPATPDRLASLVTDSYADAVRQLRARVDDFESGSSASPQFITRLRDDANRARHFAGLMRWFVDRDYMMLPEDEAAGLATIELVGQQVRGVADADSLRGVLRPLQNIRVDRRSFFCSPCVQDEASFFREFATHAQGAPDGINEFRIEVVEESSPGSKHNRFILLRLR